MMGSRLAWDEHWYETFALKERGTSMLRTSTCGVLMAALVAFAAPAYAQPAQTGTISGEIQDATGAALPGVTVTLTSQDRGFSRSTVSDENGRYVFPAVPIGLYTVNATLTGIRNGSQRPTISSRRSSTTNIPFAHEDRRAHRHRCRSSARRRSSTARRSRRRRV